LSKTTNTFVILNERGLHARAASAFVNLTSRYESRVEVEKDGRVVDGKSILGIVSLVGIRGSSINVTIDGSDAEELLEALGQLVASGFEEGAVK
jgi:phosphocarrier protein HPr